MMVCTDLCLYYETYKNFAPSRTYKTHKQCTCCNHVVSKEEFPAPTCYCCNARYRHRYPKSMISRRIARQRKRKKVLKENVIIVNS